MNARKLQIEVISSCLLINLLICSKRGLLRLLVYQAVNGQY